MRFKNTKTGLIWQVAEDVAKELRKLDYFVELSDVDKKPEDAPQFTKHDDKVECEICNKVLKNEKAYKAHKRMAHKDGEK